MGSRKRAGKQGYRVDSLRSSIERLRLRLRLRLLSLRSSISQCSYAYVAYGNSRLTNPRYIVKFKREETQQGVLFQTKCRDETVSLSGDTGEGSAKLGSADGYVRITYSTQ